MTEIVKDLKVAIKRNSMSLTKVLFGVALAISFASSASAQELTRTATCKLTNTEVDKTIYEGFCKVTPSMKGEDVIWSIQLNNTSEPFLFAGRPGEKHWKRGHEDVQFTDLGKGAIFRWSTFALAVAE